MKFEKNWPRGFRGEVVQRCGQTMEHRWEGITVAHSEHSSGELKTGTNLKYCSIPCTTRVTDLSLRCELTVLT